jgi:hypothetical protein
MISRLNKFWILVIGALVLSTAAFINGFPLVYFDTGTYLKSALSFEVPVDRPIFYSLFLGLSHALPWPKWSAIFFQGLIVAFLLNTLSRIILGSKANSFILISIIVLTGLFSSLPWHTGQLMPDIFTACLGLSYFLLIFKWQLLNIIQRSICILIFIFSVLVHHSHFMMAGFLLLIFFAISFLHSSSNKKEIRIRTLFVGLLLFCSLIITPLTNRILTGETYFSKGGHVFLLARLVQQGLIFNLLNDNCDSKNYILCPYKDELKDMTASDFIWSDKSPIDKMGGWVDSSKASWDMITDALFNYPGQFIRHSLIDTFQQLLRFNTGDFLIPYSETKTVTKVITESYKDISGDYSSSLQQNDILIKAVEVIRPFHIFLFWLSLFVVAMLFLLSKFNYLSSNNDLKLLFYFILVFLVVNAFVCASFSTIEERYQSRVSWLVVYFALVSLFRFKQTRIEK